MATGANDSFRKLTRTRVRLNRVRDGKIMTGRLVKMSTQRAEIDIFGVETCLPGEIFMVEVNGPIVKLVFPGRLDSRSGLHCTLSVGQGLQYLPVSEPARISVEGYSLTATWGEETRKGKLLDISRDGVCMLVHEPVTAGTVIELDIKGKFESYEVKGTVRYCVEMNDGVRHCRLGVQLIHDDRLSSARWMTLFKKVLDAA